MEMEWFCHPDESAKWYEFWKAERMRWWRSLGVSDAKLRLRDHDADELSFYSKMTVDIEYKYSFTDPDYGELEGIAHRGSYDLGQHQTHSGQKLEYFDQELQLKLKEQGASDEDVRANERTSAVFTLGRGDGKPRGAPVSPGPGTGLKTVKRPPVDEPKLKSPPQPPPPDPRLKPPPLPQQPPPDAKLKPPPTADEPKKAGSAGTKPNPY